MSQGFTNQQTYAVLPPTIQKFTSGSGTYTLPSGAKYIVVQMCGGGGGGSAASTGTPTNGTAGGNTTFGTSLLTANGGAAPVGGTGAVSGGLGGSFTINSPASGQGFNGGDGGAGAYLSGTTGDNAGGSGGSNPFGGSPTGGKVNTAGSSGYANTGAGGSGGGIGATGTATAGAGGGAGGYIYAVINNPSATYSYSVGAGGNGGTGYTNGGAGAAGIIIVTEYYDTIGIPSNLTLPIPVNQGGTGVTNSNWTAGSLTFSPTTQGIVGTTTNDSAGAGYVGEYISSNVPQASGVSMTTNTDTNITSISLTAGDWDVNGNVYLEPTNIGAFSAGKIWTSTTSATKPNDSNVTGILGSSTFFNAMSFTAPTIRVSVSVTTTVYLSARATFSAGTMTGYGNLTARRRR